MEPRRLSEDVQTSASGTSALFRIRKRVSRSCIASSLSFRQRQPTFSDHKTHLQKLLSRSDESQHESFCKCFVPKVTDVVLDSSGSTEGPLTLPPYNYILL